MNEAIDNLNELAGENGYLSVLQDGVLYIDGVFDLEELEEIVKTYKEYLKAVGEA